LTETKPLTKSKIAWVGVAIALINCLQIALIGFDMQKLQTPETFVPAILSLAGAVGIIFLRKYSNTIIE